MCLILAAVVVMGWLLTAGSSDDLVANAWMLLIVPGIAVAYYLLKDRVRKIPSVEEE